MDDILAVVMDDTLAVVMDGTLAVWRDCKLVLTFLTDVSKQEVAPGVKT